MENVAITALEAGVVQLALVALAVTVFGVVILVYFGSRAINNVLATVQATLKSNSELTQVTIKQTDVMDGFRRTLDRGQDLQEQQIGVQKEQVGVTKQLVSRFEERETKSDDQYKTIVEQIQEASKAQGERIAQAQTAFVGAAQGMIDQSAERFAQAVTNALQPVNEGFGVVRTALEQVTQRRAEEDARYKADLDAIWDKVADTQQTFRQTIREAIIAALGGTHENTQQQNVDDPGGDDTLPDRSQFDADPCAGSDGSADDAGSGATDNTGPGTTDSRGDSSANTDSASGGTSADGAIGSADADPEPG